MTSGVHLRQWRGIGPIAAGRRSTQPDALGNFRWGAPYLLIWIPTSLYVISALARDDCTGACAVYHALLTFTLITLATVVSAVVALIQLVVLLVRRPSQRPMHRDIRELAALLDC